MCHCSQISNFPPRHQPSQVSFHVSISGEAYTSTMPITASLLSPIPSLICPIWSSHPQYDFSLPCCVGGQMWTECLIRVSKRVIQSESLLRFRCSTISPCHIVHMLTLMHWGPFSCQSDKKACPLGGGKEWKICKMFPYLNRIQRNWASESWAGWDCLTSQSYVVIRWKNIIISQQHLQSHDLICLTHWWDLTAWTASTRTLPKKRLRQC